jgi:hypothetical protein
MLQRQCFTHWHMVSITFAEAGILRSPQSHSAANQKMCHNGRCAKRCRHEWPFEETVRYFVTAFGNPGCGSELSYGSVPSSHSSHNKNNSQWDPGLPGVLRHSVKLQASSAVLEKFALWQKPPGNRHGGWLTKTESTPTLSNPGWQGI